MKKHHGIIARLPLELRSELETRLSAGEPTERVLRWLNRHPAVTALLHAVFNGRPVSEQDLSAWRHGGLVEERAIQDSLQDAQGFADRSTHVAALGIGSAHLVADLTVRYAGLLHQWGDIPEIEFNRKLIGLQRLTTSILAVQKSELHVARLELDRERLAFLREKHRDKVASSPASSSKSSPAADQSVDRQSKNSRSSTPADHSDTEGPPPFPASFTPRPEPTYPPHKEAPPASGGASPPLATGVFSSRPGAAVSSG